MKEQEYNRLVLDKAKGNHIWINAFETINPTDKFKIQLAEHILYMLNKKENLIPTSLITSEDKELQDLAKQQQILYLSINKS